MGFFRLYLYSNLRNNGQRGGGEGGKVWESAKFEQTVWEAGYPSVYWMQRVFFLNFVVVSCAATTLELYVNKKGGPPFPFSKGIFLGIRGLATAADTTEQRRTTVSIYGHKIPLLWSVSLSLSLSLSWPQPDRCVYVVVVYKCF